MRLAYVVDEDLEVATRFQAAYGGDCATDSYETVLADASVRTVSIATPHDTHAHLAHQAIQAGKSVLIEKPPALILHDLDAIQACAQKAGVTVLPIAQHRFDPLVNLVKTMLNDGVLGTIRMAHCQLECFREADYYRESSWRGHVKREGGSVLMNQAYHFIDILLWLAGPISRVSAMMDTLRRYDVMETEDSLVASVQFRSSALGSVVITGAAGSMWRNVVEFVGDDGAVAFDLSFPARVHRLELQSKKELKWWRNAFAALQQETGFTGGTNYYGVSHRAQFRALIAAMHGEGDSRASTLEQAREVLRTILSIYRAARDGCGALQVSEAGGVR
jgi:predicted dehydrogenase